LRLNIPEGAEFLHINKDGCQLAFRVNPLKYNALNSDSPDLTASVSQQSHWLIIELPRPATLNTISVQNAPDSLKHIAIHRMDGDTIAEEASQNATKYRNKLGTQSAMPKQKGGDLFQHRQQSNSAGDQYFCDISGQKFALQLVNTNGSSSSFSVSQLLELTIQSYPNSPACAISTPQSDEQGELTTDTNIAIPIWSEAGELGASSDFPNPGLLTLDESWQQQLETSLNRLRNDLANTQETFLDIALTFSSGAPCRVNIEQLALDYQAVATLVLEQQGEAGQLKTSLKFDGSLQQRHHLEFQLPAHSHLHKAQLILNKQPPISTPLCWHCLFSKSTLFSVSQSLQIKSSNPRVTPC